MRVDCEGFGGLDRCRRVKAKQRLIRTGRENGEGVRPTKLDVPLEQRGLEFQVFGVEGVHGPEHGIGGAAISGGYGPRRCAQGRVEVCDQIGCRRVGCRVRDRNDDIGLGSIVPVFNCDAQRSIAGEAPIGRHRPTSARQLIGRSGCEDADRALGFKADAAVVLRGLQADRPLEEDRVSGIGI